MPVGCHDLCPVAAKDTMIRIARYRPSSNQVDPRDNLFIVGFVCDSMTLG